MKYIQFFTVLFLLTVYACREKNIDQLKDDHLSFHLLDERFGLDVQISLDKEGTYHLTREEETLMKKYLAGRASEEVKQASVSAPLTIVFFRASPEDYAGSKLTISGWTEDMEGIVTQVAVEFDRLKTGLPLKSPEGTYGGGTVHRCLGDGCACCGFIREPSVETGLPGTANKVIGCSCDTSPGDCSKSVGPCNHWIHSGP